MSNTIGEKSTPIRPHESALSQFFCSPLPLEERSEAAAQGSAGGRIGVDNGQVHREVPPPVPRLQQDVRSWASAVPGDVHLAGMQDPGLGKDLAEKRLSAKVPIPEA